MNRQELILEKHGIDFKTVNGRLFAHDYNDTYIEVTGWDTKRLFNWLGY